MAIRQVRITAVAAITINGFDLKLDWVMTISLVLLFSYDRSDIASVPVFYTLLHLRLRSRGRTAPQHG